ncbi:MAG: TetR/AcrR family transcriptional regulator [Deltaproteobacteria bacterium]|nr:MAG: TetR/AcrR family transcriptional regulator [Deltaproteobacteria bacterium]
MRTAAALRERDGGARATRRAILAAAEALLARGGEEGLSIRELCARAGVTPPTVYHHFGDKGALVDRLVDACFAEFDRTFTRRRPPADPVEALRWGFDRYVEYGLAHPAHYRLMFHRSTPRRPTPAAVASYDRLRRRVAAIAAAGRLVPPLEDATAAFWSAVHGVTSLLIAGFWRPGAPAATLVRDAMINQLTAQLTRKEAAPCRPTRIQTPSSRETSRPGARKARPGTSPSSARFPAS